MALSKIGTPGLESSISTNLTGTVNGFTPTVSNMAGRNRIINGAMMIDQRNAGAAVTGDGLFPVDRWKCSSAGGGAFSMQQSSTAPTGFTKSVVCTVTTVDSSIAASDEYSYRHFVEGFNFADMKWGSSDAKTITLSFWVRSSVTGTYAVGLRNNDGNRTYPATYTVSSADTWEYKTITISGDTTGTWVGSTNGIGVGVIFSLGAGSNFQGTANSWNASGTWSTSSATQWIATSGATFYITGVQLEEGSVATPFEHRQYGQELALCQRYFFKPHQEGNNTPQIMFFGLNSSSGQMQLFFPTTMRAKPSVTVLNTAPYWESYPWNAAGTSLTGLLVNTGHSGADGGDYLLAGTFSPTLSRGVNYTTIPYNFTFSAEL